MTRKEARPNFARSNKRRARPVHFRLIHPRFRGGQTLHAICPPDKVLVTQNVHADDSGLNSGKWNCSVCCSGDVFLISLRHLQNSIQNSSISGVQSWIVTQYRYLEPLQLPRLPRMSPWSMVSDCTTIYCTCAEGVGRHEIVDRAKKVRSEGNSFSDNKTQLKIHKCPVLPTCPRYYMARCVRCVKAHRGKGTNLTRPCWKVRTFHEGESRKITMASG